MLGRGDVFPAECRGGHLGSGRKCAAAGRVPTIRPRAGAVRRRDSAPLAGPRDTGRPGSCFETREVRRRTTEEADERRSTSLFDPFDGLRFDLRRERAAGVLPAAAFEPAGAGTSRFRIGDRARFAQDGRLHFLGRDDRVVKVRGNRVDLTEVEAALRSHPGVTDLASVARQAGIDTALIAYVVPRPGAAA